MTVAKEVELADRFENMGAQIVREVRRQKRRGRRRRNKRGIDMAVNVIVADLRKNAKKVSTNEEIAQAGTIAANGDR